MNNYYDSISQGYDELYGAEQLEKLERIAAILEEKGLSINPSWSLLDVGCGTGISTAFFDCAKKTGVDPSEGLLDIARKKYPSIEFKISAAQDLDTQAPAPSASSAPTSEHMMSRANQSEPQSEKRALVPAKFDLVISLTAAQNFTDVEKSLRNMLQVGKRFIISILKNSQQIEQVRKILLEKGFEEFEIGKDVVFIMF